MVVKTTIKVDVKVPVVVTYIFDGQNLTILAAKLENDVSLGLALPKDLAEEIFQGLAAEIRCMEEDKDASPRR